MSHTLIFHEGYRNPDIVYEISLFLNFGSNFIKTLFDPNKTRLQEEPKLQATSWEPVMGNDKLWEAQRYLGVKE